MKMKTVRQVLRVLLLAFCFANPGSIASQSLQHRRYSPRDANQDSDLSRSSLLGGQRNSQQLVVEGYFADGFAEDLSSQVSLHSDNPAIVRVEGRCRLSGGQRDHFDNC